MPSEPLPVPVPEDPAEHRLHPLSIGFMLGGQIRRAILPLIFGAASASFLGGVGMRTVIFVGFVPFAIASVVRYLTFRYRYEATELVIRSGLLFRRERHVPYARIQNLDAVQGVLHRLFGVVEVKLQTGGGDEPEATMSVLPLPALESLRSRILEGKGEVATGEPDPSPVEVAVDPQAADDAGIVAGAEARTLLHLPTRELILHGLIQNRGMLLIAAAFGLAWETGLAERLTEQAGEDDSVVPGLIEGLAADVTGAGAVAAVGAAIALIVALLVLARLLSMAWALVRLHDYRIVRSGEDLRATFGGLTRVAATIPLRRIQTLTIHEGPLHRWAGRVAVGVETAGGERAGEADPHRHRLAPILRRARLWTFVGEVIPELGTGEDLRWEPVSPGAFRRVVKEAGFVATLAALPFYFLVGAWGVAIHAAFLAWATLYARRYVDHLGWALKDDMVWFRSGWLWRRTTIARFSKIQVVALRATPFDRRREMARLRVDTAGAGAAWHKVEIPYLPASTARELRTFVAAEAARTEFRW
ncbi:PH domain-containing protein [Candidatus Palauibacter sp.]|uniref:PH domain-containing protein n=1 Tax=Candidatus Palauibacter sp. TaxID=3101350 RepID=UPI003B5A4CDB